MKGVVKFLEARAVKNTSSLPQGFYERMEVHLKRLEMSIEGPLQVKLHRAILPHLETRAEVLSMSGILGESGAYSANEWCTAWMAVRRPKDSFSTSLQEQSWKSF